MNRFFFFVCVLYGKYKCYDTKIIYGNMLLYEIKKKYIYKCEKCKRKYNNGLSFDNV